jgi:hypothetical protein
MKTWIYDLSIGAMLAFLFILAGRLVWIAFGWSDPPGLFFFFYGWFVATYKARQGRVEGAVKT